jgi:rod shape-determining protein MreC
MISVGLVVQNNSYQKSSFLNSTNFIASNVLFSYSKISGYFGLQRTNLILAEENARLRSQSVLSFAKYQNNHLVHRDTIYKQQYSFLTASVINNSINKRNNYLTLNKGSDQGIKTEMGVISSNGIIGVVKEVSPNFCAVLSVLHQEFRVSSKLKNQGHFGSLIWNGIDYTVGNLNDIPNHVEVLEGDTVVTSGYSSIFPDGIIIGFVKSIEKQPGDPYYTIQVQFSEDIKKVAQVYVVNNLFKEEKQNIENSADNSLNDQ